MMRRPPRSTLLPYATPVRGQNTNIGTVTAQDATGKTVTASNPDNYFGASPGVSLVKKTNGTDNDTPPGPTIAVGSTVTGTSHVSNPGNSARPMPSSTDDKTA